MTAPMTAAEYRMIHGGEIRTVGGRRILAALEEREALLGEREAGKPKGLVAADEYALMIKGQRVIVGVDVLATLRHHEAKAADASVGALVRRIREHPMNQGHAVALVTSQRPKVDWCDADYWLNESGLTSALSHLDSLLPKEPEVAPLRWTDPAPSGKQYRVENGVVWAQWANHAPWEAEWRCSDVSVEDAPVVAKLMAKGGKDGEWAMLEQEYQKRFGEDSNAK